MKAKKKVLGYTSGTMVQTMKVNGIKIRSTELESIPG